MKKILRIFLFLIASVAVIFIAAFIFLPLPGNIPVLMYHFIGTHEDAVESKNFVSRENFQRQMWFLHTFGYRALTLDEYYEIRSGKRKPRGREILITFDDGNTTFQTEVFPVLKAYHLPAAAFIISESVKHAANGSMDEETIKDLYKSGLVTLGAHSKTHPSLSELPEEDIKDELAGSKADLEQMFGIPFSYMAYPNGDIDARVIRIAEESGYKLAFTTSHKKLKGLDDRGFFAITRTKISRTSDNPFIYWFKLSGFYTGFKAFRYHAAHPAIPASPN